MSAEKDGSKMFQVVAAAAVVAVLAGILGIRLLADTASYGDSDRTPLETRRICATAPGAASVPDPVKVPLQQVEIPSWASKDAKEWPVRFRTDLDLLAPLGTGNVNAAEWFVDFTKISGPRLREYTDAMERRVPSAVSYIEKRLPADDPLLLEAEPWCDQATMHFYTDLLEVDGWATVVPNLLLPLTLAKSWVARGLEAEDPAAGMDDCRRAVRLGRLLRQEDTVIISDLVGLACIRAGAQGIYDIAVRHGDLATAVIGSIVVGEADPQKLMTSERLTRVRFESYLSKNMFGRLTLDLPDEQFREILEMARSGPDRRFRSEAILTLNFSCHWGERKQLEETRLFLEELSRSEDTLIAKLAAWSLEHVPDRRDLAEYLP